MDWVALLVGIFIGYFIEKILDNTLAWFQKSRQVAYWKKAEKTWKEYQKSLAYGLEVIQMGWNEGIFSPEEIVITLDGEYKLPEIIYEKIRKNHETDWVNQNITNDVQVGIYSIDPHRTSDNLLGSNIEAEASHQLRILGHRYHYFDFLSTHKAIYYGTSEEKIFLQNIVGNSRHYLNPYNDFPNVLSVGLSFFAEKGNCLVLTQRTALASSGGHWAGKLIFNAVGECIAPKDVNGSFRGISRISPWVTAKRGLYEEMGIEYFDDDRGSSLGIHSFAYDNRILDYKFFGYVINDYSRADVHRCWINALDKNENLQIIFYDSATKSQCLGIIREIMTNKSQWSSEAIFCTCLSLLQLRKITYKDIQNLIDKY